MIRFIKANYLLLIVATIAAITRFYNLGSTSLSNDELSSVIRAQYSSLTELYQKGIATDVHPAGLQIFLYFWVQLVGENIWWLRLPFAMAGVGSVIILFQLARKYISMSAALLVGGMWAVLSYPVLYGTIVRMYSLASFSSLLAIWYLLKYLNEGKCTKHLLSMCIMVIITAYLHYMALLFIVLVALYTMLFSFKKIDRPLVLACGMMIIAYFPAFLLITQQISTQSLEGFLPIPTSNAAVDYWNYSWNNNTLLSIALLILLLISIIRLKFAKGEWLFYCSLFLFFGQFVVMYCYSIYKSPLLQYSGLIFSTPFALVAASYALKGVKRGYLISVVIIFFAAKTTVIDCAHYDRNHFGVFKEPVMVLQEWENQKGIGATTIVFNVINQKYIQFYFNQLGLKPSVAMYNMEHTDSLKRFTNIVANSKTTYFYYCWTNAIHYDEAVAVIQDFFPFQRARHRFHNSAIYIFSNRTKTNLQPKYQTILNSSHDANLPIEQILNVNVQYSATFEKFLGELPIEKGNKVQFDVDFKNLNKKAAAVIAIQMGDSLLHYRTMELKNFELAQSGLGRAHVVMDIDTLWPEDATLKAYVNNFENDSLQIKNLRLTVWE